MSEQMFQYYYKENKCQAASAGDADCICWHNEGTGPRGSERHDISGEKPTLLWRSVTPTTTRDTQ